MRRSRTWTWWCGAAGSLPGDLHRFWRPGSPLGYHLECGYWCMGYEIAGAGSQAACPEREVYCMVGDGSYLMMAQEIVTAVQEGIKIVLVLLDNHGYGSIGGLSESLGKRRVWHVLSLSQRHHRSVGWRYPAGRPGRQRGQPGGSHPMASTRKELRLALEEAPGVSSATVIRGRDRPCRTLSGVPLLVGRPGG